MSLSPYDTIKLIIRMMVNLVAIGQCSSKIVRESGEREGAKLANRPMERLRAWVERIMIARTDAQKEVVMRGFVYENAPLVEVVAEIRWQLKYLASAPNAKIDPYYELFRDDFLAVMKKALPNVEALVPDEIPAEFLSGQPHLRIRSKPGGSPLVQIGPGVITVNMVPPYEGWGEFRRFLLFIMSKFYESYPLAEKTLSISSAHLRYINAFTEYHGVNAYGDFVENHLGARIPVRPEVIESGGAKVHNLLYWIDAKFENQAPVNSISTIKIGPSHVKDQNTVLLELLCDSLEASDIQLPTTLERWFNGAHLTLRKNFERTISEELSETFGRRIEVNG